MRAQSESNRAIYRITTSTLLAGFLFAGAGRLAAQSPAGTWDFSLSGDLTGNAVVQFVNTNAASGVFSGFQISALGPRLTKAQYINPRNGTVEDGRVDPNPRDGSSDSGSSGSGGGSSNAVSSVVIGGSLLGGSWFLTSPGRLAGFFVSVSRTVELVETNATNISGGVTNVVTTNILVATLNTNSVSFTGVLKGSSRLTLNATGTNANFSLRGVPAVAIAGVATNYFAQGVRLQSGVKNQFFEAFSLRPTTNSLIPPAIAPFVYDYDAFGAGYDLLGTALVSRHNQMAINAQNTGDLSVRTLTGSFKPSNLRATLKGSQGGEKITAFRSQPQ
jgi:hypothetical protein